MSKRRGRCVGSFDAARECGYHSVEVRPRRGEPQIHAMAVNTFIRHAKNGLAPAADFYVGNRGRWYLSSLARWKAEREALADRGKTKKPDEHGNAHQANAENPSVKESTDGAHVPRHKRPVKDIRGEVRHANPR